MNQNNPNIHVLWSSDIDLNDWKDYIKECYEDYQYDSDGGMSLCSELEDYFNKKDGEESSFDEFYRNYENEIYERIAEVNDMYLDDERMNLDIPTEGRIMCIADLGLWNGRTQGYSYEGNNISSIFHSHVSGMSVMDFYVEKCGRTLELKAEESHHDGTNYYTFRELKPNLSDTQIRNFENKLYNGEATPADISRYTRALGQEVQKVYGFELGKKAKQQERD